MNFLSFTSRCSSGTILYISCRLLFKSLFIIFIHMNTLLYSFKWMNLACFASLTCCTLFSRNLLSKIKLFKLVILVIVSFVHSILHCTFIDLIINNLHVFFPIILNLLNFILCLLHFIFSNICLLKCLFHIRLHLLIFCHYVIHYLIFVSRIHVF